VGADREPVAVTLGRVRHEQLPHAAAAAVAHRVAARVPGVEVADDAHALRIRRPDGEAHTLDGERALAQGQRVRAQHLEGPQVRALMQVVQVGVGQQRRVAVGVVVHPLGALLPAHPQPVVEAPPPARHLALEEARRVAPRQHRQRAGAAGLEHRDLSRPRQQRAHPQRAVCVGVQAQHREGVRVAGLQQRLEVGFGEHGHARRQSQGAPAPADRLMVQPRSCSPRCNASQAQPP
jgi:hypothetical protein